MHRIFVEFTRPAKGFKPISWLIRVFQGTKYSHVRIRWITRGTNSEICYEAGGGSIRFMGQVALSSSPAKIMKRYAIELTNPEYKELLKYCLKYAGINYGKIQIIGMAFSYLFRNRKNKLADGKKTMVCSELVYYLLKEVLKYDIDFRPEVDGPKELDKQLEKLDNKLIQSITRLR